MGYHVPCQDEIRVSEHPLRNGIYRRRGRREFDRFGLNFVGRSLHCHRAPSGRNPYHIPNLGFTPQAISFRRFAAKKILPHSRPYQDNHMGLLRMRNTRPMPVFVQFSLFESAIGSSTNRHRAPSGRNPYRIPNLGFTPQAISFRRFAAILNHKPFHSNASLMKRKPFHRFSVCV